MLLKTTDLATVFEVEHCSSKKLAADGKPSAAFQTHCIPSRQWRGNLNEGLYFLILKIG